MPKRRDRQINDVTIGNCCACVLNLYFKGAYSEDEALRRLLPHRLKDQYAMKTDAALACLKFVERRLI